MCNIGFSGALCDMEIANHARVDVILCLRDLDCLNLGFT